MTSCEAAGREGWSVVLRSEVPSPREESPLCHSPLSGRHPSGGVIVRS